MPKLLDIIYLGNPMLRTNARHLSKDEILSENIQQLIKDMHYTLKERQYGVGLAAPQIGESVAISVIGIKPTPTRPQLDPFSAVLINPEIVEMFDNPSPMWEGCVSSGTDENTLFAQVPRHGSVRLKWLDEHAKRHDEIVDGFVAHVAQHETDHLNGVLFVDRVTDTSTYMTADEYKKRIVDAKK